jgi:hypothetical protein
MATFFISGDDSVVMERNLGSKITGMLSTQKKPISSNARSAVLLPEPERPVIMTTRRFFI